MKANYISSLVSSQIPEYQRESYPLFVSLLEAYYDFTGNANETLYVSKNLINLRKVDNASTFIDFFSSEYLNKFPAEIKANKALVVKRILDLYRTKGSPKSIEIFFRLVYDEETRVSYPGENILIASGSKWVQESSIRLSIQSGATELAGTEQILTWTNSSGTFNISTTRIKLISGTIYEIFFKSVQKIVLNFSDIVTCASSNTIIFGSGALKTISNIQILTTGKNFKNGQIFRIPGVVGDTLFRVTQIGANGVLQKIQMIDFGYGYADSQTVSINPYSNVPVEGSYSVAVVGSVITLTITDTTSPVLDNGTVNSVLNSGTAEAYFLEDYFADGQDYLAVQVGSFQDNAGSANSSNDQYYVPVSQADYLLSFANIKTITDTITTYPGFYETVNGNISDPSIRIQDNFYYQAYSYVISSAINLPNYKKSFVDLIHPAGYALFADLTLTDKINMVANIEDYLNRIKTLAVTESILVTEDSTNYLPVPYYMPGYIVDGYIANLP